MQSQRERDGARAQLHELQLSMRTEGEFGRAGKRLRCGFGQWGGWVCAGGWLWAVGRLLCSGSCVAGQAMPLRCDTRLPADATEHMHLFCCLLHCSPYKGPVGVDASEGHEVAQMVGNIEQASATGG